MDRLPGFGVQRQVSDGPGTSRSPADEAALVAAQLGRVPREPWRVAASCEHGYPTVIVSPGLLGDGTPFPAYAWLTCPHLVEQLSAEEAAGATAGWAARAQVDVAFAERLMATDAAVREARARESGGSDPCQGVGLAGQRRPLGVKCLHAHVALVLAGIGDPIGEAELGKIDPACSDVRCNDLRG
jgi:uncharacterized protein